jgi:hypothetical protein
MNRREILKAVGVLLGSTLVTPAYSRLLEGYSPIGSLSLGSFFTVEQKKLVAEIAETIIPETTTPGAKAAGVADFIEAIVGDCYDAKDQARFLSELAGVETVAQRQLKKGFVAATSAEKIAVLTEIEAVGLAQRAQNATKVFWFEIKELTRTGYFTSELGATKALEYVWVPGKYDPCLPISEGKKGYAVN